MFFEFFKIGLFAIGGGLATFPFLESLSEKDRALLLQKLEGKETTHHHSTHKHKHHHHKKRHSYSLFYNKQTICYCNA